RIPNKSGESGRPSVAWARSSAYKSEVAGGRSCVASLDYFLQSAFDVGNAGVEHGTAGVEHNVPRSEKAPLHPEGFAQAALDAIALDGFTDRARHREAQPRSGAVRLE